MTVTKLITVTATCVVDGNAVNTFDNNTYPVKLGPCWQVVMIEVPKNPAGVSSAHQWHSSSTTRNQSSNVAVLVRGRNSGPEKVNNHYQLMLK
jgi:hypothetical protein